MSIITTFSGENVNLLLPDPATLHIEDIAHALSNLCRYTGHSQVFYSVAEHAVRASWIVPKGFEYDALMHDVAEAYLGDVSSPLKSLLPDYRYIEQNFERAIFKRFRVREPLFACVKHADLVMLATERRDLMPHSKGHWPCLDGVKPLSRQIHPYPPNVAYAKFISRFRQLAPLGVA